MAKLNDQIAALTQMLRSELQTEWERVCNRPAPNLSPDLLRLGITYHLQAKDSAGLSRASSMQLKNSVKAPPAIKPGTRLIRSWNGKTVSVEVVQNGFVFEDRQYSSLSAIAREVTGSHWSGPRFFGLRGQTADG